MPAPVPAIAKAVRHLEAGDWQAAHAIVQKDSTSLGCWAHGIVHLIEGDLDNARYWYDRAGVQFSKSKTFASEIGEIAKALATRPRAAAVPRTNTRRSPPKRSGSRRSRA
jgi:hypothetical protein